MQVKELLCLMQSFVLTRIMIDSPHYLSSYLKLLSTYLWDAKIEDFYLIGSVCLSL